MQKERALEIRSLGVVYGSLILVSCVADFFSHRQLLWSWTHSDLTHPRYIVFGIFFAFFYVTVALVSARLFRWGAELEKIFSQVLTPLSYFQIIQLAILSGLVEEWFFRGILLNHFGVMISSITFGLAHFLPGRAIWRWSFISFFAGLILGALYYYSGSLWLVAVVHMTINGVLLFKLNQAHMNSPTLT
jgi:membrane protease YdiL (CAAX protease family)